MVDSLSQIAQNPAKLESLKRRYFDKVSKDGANGCWKWVGAKNERGYGHMSSGRGCRLKAHRVSYLIHYGESPGEMCVLHKCDNPECTNPAHLFLGTKKDNTQDMLSKNRGSKPPTHLGEQHPNAKLTFEQAAEIAKDPRPYSQIAKSYGLHPITVSRIKKGNWRLGWDEQLNNIPIVLKKRDALSDEDVLKIFKDARHSKEIAQEYGIPQHKVQSIWNRAYRKDLTQNLPKLDRTFIPELRQGEKVNTAKLTEEQVIKIFYDKRKARIIADEHGVGKGAVDAIRQARTWKHITVKLRNGEVSENLACGY